MSYFYEDAFEAAMAMGRPFTIKELAEDLGESYKRTSGCVQILCKRGDLSVYDGKGQAQNGLAKRYVISDSPTSLDGRDPEQRFAELMGQNRYEDAHIRQVALRPTRLLGS